MNIKDFALVMTYLFNAYGKDVNDNVIKTWYAFFKENTIDEFKNAVYQIVKTERYFPSIAMVNEVIVKQNIPCLSLDGEDEWQKVLDAIHEHGWDTQKALDSLALPTRNVVERLGYNHLCMADGNLLYNYRSSFLKAFENEKQNIKLLAMLGEKLPNSVQLKGIKERNDIGKYVVNMLENKKID